MDDIRAIETKLAAARTRLILDKPFLGALVLRLPMNAANPDWCPTTATDARKFYFNPEYIAALSMDETQFMLAHEALHCALSHFARRQHRLQHRWDLACDFAINPLLVDDGLRPPPNALLLDAYQGMTAEEIYPLIADDPLQQTLDTHAYDRDPQAQGHDSRLREDRLSDPARGRRQEQEADAKGGQGSAREHRSDASPVPGDSGSEAPPPLAPDERETLAIQWRQRLAGAAQQAKQAQQLKNQVRSQINASMRTEQDRL